MLETKSEIRSGSGTITVASVNEEALISEVVVKIKQTTKYNPNNIEFGCGCRGQGCGCNTDYGCCGNIIAGC